jgi:hypothetical protein
VLRFQRNGAGASRRHPIEVGSKEMSGRRSASGVFEQAGPKPAELTPAQPSGLGPLKVTERERPVRRRASVSSRLCAWRLARDYRSCAAARTPGISLANLGQPLKPTGGSRRSSPRTGQSAATERLARDGRITPHGCAWLALSSLKRSPRSRLAACPELGAAGVYRTMLLES